MRRRSFVTAILASLILPCLTAGPTAAQATDPAAAERPAFLLQERIDVNIVNVEVVVTRKGQPVTDLGVDDFRIEDDGHEIEITNFFEVRGGQRRLVARPGEEASTSPEKGYVIILVDNSFLRPVSRKQGLTEIRRHLDRILGENNLIMVADKATSVRIEQHFTDDSAEVLAALDRIEKRASYAGMTAGQERIIQAQLVAAAPPVTQAGGNVGLARDPGISDAGDLLAQINLHAQGVASEVKRSLGTLDSFLGSLAGLKGRKAMIYLADDLPLRPAELLFFNWFEKYSEYAAQLRIASPEEGTARYDTTPYLAAMLAKAASNRISLYPITPDNNPLIAAGSASQEGALSSMAYAVESTLANSSGILLMARETGGLLAPSVASIDNLVDRLATDLGSYYSLGFASPHGGDSRSHRVRVSVSDPDLQVRHLRSYQDKSAEQLLTERTLSAVYLESTENPLDAWIEVGDIERESKNRYVVPLMVKFPLGRLTLLPEARAHVGQVSICVIVRDEEGRISDPQTIPVPVTIPNDKMLAANTTAAAWPTRLAMRPGKGQRIGISIRDDVSAISSTLNVEIDVAAGSATSARPAKEQRNGRHTDPAVASTLEGSEALR